MTKKQWLSIIGYLVATFPVAFIWHMILFHENYEALGIYTRLDDPIMEFGMLSMIIQGLVLAIVFPQTTWSQQGLSGGLKFAWLMGLFFASGTVLAAVAKVQVTDLTQWFLLSGGFAFIHFTFVGLVLGWIYKK